MATVTATATATATVIVAASNINGNHVSTGNAHVTEMYRWCERKLQAVKIKATNEDKKTFF